MSNVAAGVLKDALKKAEADRDKVAKDTEHIRSEGERAQHLVDQAQEVVDELIQALDRLNRPEHLSGVTVDVPMQDSPSFTRPEVEERRIAGIGITRRAAS